MLENPDPTISYPTGKLSCKVHTVPCQLCQVGFPTLRRNSVGGSNDPETRHADRCQSTSPNMNHSIANHAARPQTPMMVAECSPSLSRHLFIPAPRHIIRQH